MHVERSLYAALNVLPVQPVIRPAKTSKKNVVTDLIKHLMSAMDVLSRSITALLLTSILTTHVLLIENIAKSSAIPELVST
jgi:hypothetical protein